MKKILEIKSKIEKINENQNYTFYSGIDENKWNSIWKNKELIDRETNMTDNYFEALEFSWDGTVIEVSNIPTEAIIGVRDEEYLNDEDWINVSMFSNQEKNKYINSSSLFLVNLFSYKNQINVKLV